MKIKSMNMKTVLWYVGIMMVVGTLGLFAFTSGNGDRCEGRGRGHGDMMAKMAEKLNLTADQKARIQAYQDQFTTANASVLQEIKTLHEQMRTQMKDGNTDAAKTTREQLMTKEKSLETARQSLMTQIKSVLTPEQLAQAEKMHQGGKGMGCCRHGRGDRDNDDNDNKGDKGENQKSAPQGNSDLH